MKRPGPLLTLLAGLLLGLFMLSLNATTGTKSASSSYREESPSPKASSSPTPTRTTPSPTPSKSAFANADYAGRTDDDSSAVAVSLRDGKAIAYFCDGRDKESWLKGDVKDDGTMKLTGKHGAELDGTLKAGKSIRGTVDLGGQRYGFTADKAIKPSGLYRATATVRGAKLDGGWIVLPGGRQVGILDRDGKPSAAPRIDPETGAVTIDGQKITARPVTP
jgi:major membrane immunogen (membrane-anchored lipoprotein)